MSTKQTDTPVPSFTEVLLAKVEAEITEVKVSGSVNYHLMRRAGLKRRSLTIKYQCLQILDYLSGKQNKKYRKHYRDHYERLAVVDAMPYYVEGSDGKMKCNYNAISKEYLSIIDALKESEEIIQASGSGKSLKLKHFKTATTKIKAKVDEIINSKTDNEVLTVEEVKVA